MKYFFPKHCRQYVTKIGVLILSGILSTIVVARSAESENTILANDEAVKNIEKIRINLVNTDDPIMISHLFEDQELNQDAISEYEVMLLAQASSLSLERGNRARGLQRASEARQAAISALEKIPETDRSRRARILFVVGYLEERGFNDLPSAAAAYRAALEESADDSEIALRLAKVEARLRLRGVK